MKVLSSLLVLILIGISQPASANLITNGDFETGDFEGWSSFLANSQSSVGDQRIDSFDVDGNGESSFAAFFRVGRLPNAAGQGGGGIFQSFDFGGGNLFVSLDIASSREGTGANFSGGEFSLFINDVLIDSVDFGTIVGTSIERDTLSGVVQGLSAGLQEIRILMTRPFANVGNPLTPAQHIDNVVANQVSAPSALALFILGTYFVRVFSRVKAAKPVSLITSSLD